jgi:hypothetical protein
VFIDLLRATHGPQNIPVTIAPRRMLIHSHTFRVMAVPFAIRTWRVYELTDSGKTTLVQWTREMLSVPSREFPEFPAAISVLLVLTPKDALKQLEKRIARLEPEIARLDSRTAATHFLPRMFRLEIELLHAQAVAELRWVQAIADDLRTGRLTWNKAWVKKAVKELGQQHCDDGEGA